jgi:N utilization substance protein B
MNEAKPAKTARRQAREVALQALYAWQLSQGDALEQMKCIEGFEDADRKLAESIVRGVRDRAPELQTLISPHLDRAFERLSPVERAILYIGSFELCAHPATPFKVVLNEAIELGKSYGGAEGHRFVNGVLEKVAAALRPDEVAKSRPA